MEYSAGISSRSPNRNSHLVEMNQLPGPPVPPSHTSTHPINNSNDTHAFSRDTGHHSDDSGIAKPNRVTIDDRNNRNSIASSRPPSMAAVSSIVRKKSLVRPERQRLDPSNPRYHTLARRATLLEQQARNENPSSSSPSPPDVQSDANRRHSSSRGTPAADNARNSYASPQQNLSEKSTIKTVRPKRACLTSHGWWTLASRTLTFYIPSSLLRCFGMYDKSIQQAWREKMALVTIILFLCAAVGFLTFGFQAALCPSEIRRTRFDELENTQVAINGHAFNMSEFRHPVTALTKNLTSLPGNLLEPPFNVGTEDLSFLFQNTQGACKDLLVSNDNAVNRNGNGGAAFFFPCQPIFKNSTAASLNAAWKPPSAAALAACHTASPSAASRQLLNQKTSTFKRDVFYTWEDVHASLINNGKLFIYNGLILDANRLNFLSQYVTIRDDIGIVQRVQSGEFTSKDATYLISRLAPQWGTCLSETIMVGVLDASSVGCVISDIVLYISLMVIVGVVLARFFLAVLFGWFISWRIGNVEHITFEERRKREGEIEAWTDRNNALLVGGSPTGSDSSTETRNQTTAGHRGSFYGGEGRNSGTEARRSSIFPSASRFSTPRPASEDVRGAYLRKYDSNNYSASSNSLALSESGSIRGNGGSMNYTPPASPLLNPHGRHFSEGRTRGSGNSMVGSAPNTPQIHPTMPPPPPTITPFNFPLVHTILLVTCYSEDTTGLRASFDSLCTTEYPNSHKMLLVICDGIITGHGNSASTPDICLSMLEDEIVPREYVQAHSYVAIADGKRRHNMAKVFAGFYKYDNRSVPVEKQQRVPMIVLAKCGTPEESNGAKPGNRGKRDSQVLLMSFLQKVMFDERMTTLEYEFFNAIWNVTGVTPDNFEIVLMVDADTKVYTDALTRMVAVMTRDPNVMGLCGETKIANKSDSWVTAIQVFEYYISHHLAKAFESIFGGVTCLPGCFCMYRIKAPKGPNGYWVPILANPDIVEHYSENIVDTLHKKNLLLLGEDRYLSTLMLRTFPKRKMLFVPQAVCKTVVPDTFSVLLSQRRRWINSTVHNLFELVLVRDLCGTFCFSMQFVIFAELVGTLVLPAAITFTFYLVIISIIPSDQPTPIIPLLLLAAVLGLPAILILMTSRKIVYVFWMFVYLLSLPIWNFMLPMYAYWHFDDFSWGQTRMVAGEEAGHDHSQKEGEFDSTKIVMKRWCEFERDKRRRTLAASGIGGGMEGRPRSNSAASLVGMSPASWNYAGSRSSLYGDSEHW